MNYKALQAALKGHTSVKLNSKATVLQAEYDRLFLDGSVCDLPVPVATQQSQPEVIAVTPAECLKQNKLEDLAGGSFYKRPVVKTPVNAQKVSEVKRQASQAPRLATPVSQKYENRAVNDIRKQQIKGSSKKVSCKFGAKHDEFFVNTAHKRFTDSLGSTERQALDNVKSFAKAVVNVAIGFHTAQVKRNAA